MKIKMIDLLEKMAKGKEMPKKIIYNNIVLKYDEENGDYYQYYGKGLFEYLFTCSLSFLNVEVEIIKENNKIEFKEIEKLSCGPYEFTKKAVNELIENQKKLIDEINKLKDLIDAKN